jgi:tetratricopeptide (TPR) repeat protein
LLNRAHEELRCYNKALAINHGNIDALNNKGVCLMRMGRDQEGMACFDAIKINENNACSFFNQGMGLKNKGRYWDALLSLEKGLEVCPDDEEALECVNEIIIKLVKGGC